MSRPIACILAAMIAVGAWALPALGRFDNPGSVGANTLATTTVVAPVLDSTVAGTTPCHVTLSWTAPATGTVPDGYDLYRSGTSGGPYSFVKHVGSLTMTTDASVASLTTYYYVLRSTRAAWVSGNSNQRSVTTLLCV